MLTQEIDLVIFDCDGVLIDSEIISSTILIAELEASGVFVTFDYFQKNFLGRSFPKVAEAVRKTFNVALHDAFEETYRHRLLAAFETQLRPTNQVADVLGSITTAKCVATSSSPTRVKRSLSLTGLTDFFGEDVFTSSLVPNGKPAPDLFYYASEKMNVIPDRCLVIEDSLPGIEAAVSAGMHVWRFTGGSHLKGASESTDDQFSHLPVFDNWQKFFEMAPQLKQENTIFEDARGR